MDQRLKNIYRCIVQLSDSALQKKIWLNQNNDTGLISSYDELMNTLFDDFQFDLFIDSEVVAFGFDEVLIEKLKTLRELLNAYQEKETNERILNDPEWLKIVDFAASVRETWDRHPGLEDSFLYYE